MHIALSTIMTINDDYEFHSMIIVILKIVVVTVTVGS